MNLIYEASCIYALDETGKVIAEVTFPNISEQIVNINHTFVDDSLRGQGVAGILLEAAASQIRQQHKKAYPTCSYAVKWFEKHLEYADILAEKPNF